MHAASHGGVSGIRGLLEVRECKVGNKRNIRKILYTFSVPSSSKPYCVTLGTFHGCVCNSINDLGASAQGTAVFGTQNIKEYSFEIFLSSLHSVAASQIAVQFHFSTPFPATDMKTWF